jgi:hypothetical protein
MGLDINMFITGAAIVVMVYCLYLVLTLKSKVSGGIVGKNWGFLRSLVIFFTLGYLATPFMSSLPDSTIRLIVSLIFLFGAIYVVITVKLIYRIIEELSA